MISDLISAKAPSAFSSLAFLLVAVGGSWGAVEAYRNASDSIAVAREVGSLDKVASTVRLAQATGMAVDRHTPVDALLGGRGADEDGRALGSGPYVLRVAVDGTREGPVDAILGDAGVAEDAAGVCSKLHKRGGGSGEPPKIDVATDTFGPFMVNSVFGCFTVVVGSSEVPLEAGHAYVYRRL